MKKSSIMLMLMALMMSVTSFAQGLKGHVIDEIRGKHSSRSYPHGDLHRLSNL